MGLWDKDSRIWDILTILVLGFVLWLNASNFDHTEMTAIAEFIAAYGGVSYMRRKA